MKNTTIALFACAILAAVALAQPAIGILPGEEVPAVVEAPQRPGSEAQQPPGVLPGEEAPVAIAAAVASAAEAIDWGVSRVGAGADIWEKYGKAKGTKVAVLDTGCDLSHPDLMLGVLGSKDFSGSRSGPSDVHGHGTHCAGSIGARLNGDGLVGVAPECSLLVGKVLGDGGSGSDASISNGIDWSVAQGADVISMSLGSAGLSVAIREAVQKAVRAGVIVVAAAGNSGPGENTVGYPGGLADVVCVAATDSNDVAARFSSRGPAVVIAAPGVSIRSCFPGGRFAEMSGTSMATPIVAGCAAMWVANNPGIKKADRPAKFRAALMASAKDLAPPGRDTATGVGLIRLAQLLDGGVPLPPIPPAPGLTLTEADLGEDARRRLDAVFPGGRFRLEILPPAQPKE